MNFKISDYIFNFLKIKNIDTIFFISGGAAAHLLESLRLSGINAITCLHEQACAMAAESYYRVSGKPAAVLVTNGPGSTNTITGVMGAYQDSIPMFIISGQVPKEFLSSESPILLRQYGVQEVDIIPIIKPITTYAVRILNENNINQYLETAWHYMMDDRRGPVWIDVPLDIQNKLINLDKLTDTFTYEKIIHLSNDVNINFVIEKIKKSKKPLFVIGNGVHLSNAEKEFQQLQKVLKIPAISTWNAKDIFNNDDELYAGNFGILGERSGNFAVHTSDLLIIIGCRLSIPNIGYQYKLFSPNSYKIMVDISWEEINKPSLSIDTQIVMDAKEFIQLLYNELTNPSTVYEDIDYHSKWAKKIQEWKNKYPVFLPEYRTNTNKINSFFFMEELGNHLKDDDIIVTDMGTSFTCTMQSLQIKNTNRLFTSSGCSSMGFGIPGAIGAAIANPKRRIICICGDGGIQMNIQELQTIKYYNLNIIIFVLNNNGYLAISLMQDNLFNGNRIGSDSNTGVSSPSFVKLAQAYDYNTFKASSNNELLDLLPIALNDNNTPILFEISMPENQLLIPRVQSKKNPDGSIISSALYDMYPYLSDNEIQEIIEYTP